MARMWIQGKPIEVNTPEEALAFAAIADSAAPTPGGLTQEQIGRATRGQDTDENKPLATQIWERSDTDTRAVLWKMALAHPQAVTAEDLRLGDDSTRLRIVMSRLVKAGAKGKLFSKRLAWVNGVRVLNYKATEELVRRANAENWAVVAKNDHRP